jgi:hypothetical protein
MAPPDRFAVLASKLDALREADPGFELFGSERHRYALNAPLIATEIASVERRIGVALPTELRSFLAELGSGGAGPGLGLEPVTQVRGHAHARPFPFERAHLPDDAEPDDGDETSWEDGSLFLADYGCAIEARLVLVGPLRGHVWMIDGSAGAFVPFGVMAGIHSSVDGNETTDASFDFLDWYEHWLDRALS